MIQNRKKPRKSRRTLSPGFAYSERELAIMMQIYNRNSKTETIRDIANQVYKVLKHHWPTRTRTVRGIEQKLARMVAETKTTVTIKHKPNTTVKMIPASKAKRPTIKPKSCSKLDFDVVIILNALNGVSKATVHYKDTQLSIDYIKS